MLPEFRLFSTESNETITSDEPVDHGERHGIPDGPAAHRLSKERIDLGAGTLQMLRSMHFVDILPWHRFLKCSRFVQGSGERLSEFMRGICAMIRTYSDGDRLEWLRMRRALWDNCPDLQQSREMEEILESDVDEVFFAVRPGGGLCGFLEAALRSRANGCDSSPVGYIEGWYVDSDVRLRGIGRALMDAAELWAKSNGCRQMASDAELWNSVSHQAHGAVGYRETGRLVLFMKDLT
jgi:aminoglycoside 6'-N-acetyltransferase I